MTKKIMLSYLFSLLFLVIPSHTKAIIPNGVIATVGVGQTPTGMAITANGRYVYVANNNNNSIPGADSVSVIDTWTNTVLNTINDPSFDQAYTITINPAGTLAYVTNSVSTTVTIINLSTNTVTGVIPGFDGPSGMAITPDSTTGYVNNYGAGIQSGNGTTVSVVNLLTNTITATITVDQAPAAVAITPNGEFVYVANYTIGYPGTGTVQVIQTSSNTVVARITGFSGPFNIAITPNGQYAYVSNFGSNNFAPAGTTVSVINLSSNTIIATIPLAIQPSGVAITPNGDFAYVTNYNTLYLGPNFTDLTPGQGTVNIISTATNRLIYPVITVGASPANIVISPDGKRAYVSNFNADTVSVINIFDRMWLNIS